MKKLHTLFFCAILIFSAMTLRAADFGLVLDTAPAFSGQGTESNFDFTGILVPRFSAPLGDNAQLYISMGVKIQKDPWIVVPELLRTEVSFGFESGELKLGRMYYQDPLALVAQGLFDGASGAFDTNAGTFSAGVWYTGFLYKKRTEISMTGKELEALYSEVDYQRFSGTYFAPRRIFAVLGWEHPSLTDFLRLQLHLMGQFDLAGSGGTGASRLHSQYAVLKASMFWESFALDFGGCFELIQDGGSFGIGLAGELGAAWFLPTGIEDRLSFLGRFSSGGFENSSMNAFLPLTNNYQGEVLKGKFSALSMLSLAYLARLHKTLSINISSSYFIRSDQATFTRFEGDGWLLGNEFFTRLVFSPVSDVRFNLGGGVFLPGMGNVSPDSGALWRIELNVIMSLY